MTKKRVSEIAKDLKAHGILLDNKAVVAELVSLGYDVNSYLSLLEENQASAAVQRIVDKRKPRAAALPIAAKGFVPPRRLPAVVPGSDAREGGAVRKRAALHQILKSLSNRGIEIDGPRLVGEVAKLGYNVESLMSTVDVAHVAGLVKALSERSTRSKLSKPSLLSPKTRSVEARGRTARPEQLSNQTPGRAIAKQRTEVASPPKANTRRKMAGKPNFIFIDGANFSLPEGNFVRLDALIKQIRTEIEKVQIRCVFDASVRHRLTPESKVRFENAIRDKEWEQGPAGEKADKILLRYLHEHPTALVVSNDAYRFEKKQGLWPPNFRARLVKAHLGSAGEVFLMFP